MVNYFYLSRALDAIPIKRKALFTHDAFSMQKNRRSIKQFTILQKGREKSPFTSNIHICDARCRS